MKKVLFLLPIVLCWSCMSNSTTEKYQNKRDNIVDVKEQVKEIVIAEDDVMISRLALPYIVNNHLIIVDYKSDDSLIHIFDKNNFEYLISIGRKGQGPGEITKVGHLTVDKSCKELFVTDNGKQVIFSFNIDSIFANPLYLPEIKMRMKKNIFPAQYYYINDTLSITRAISPIGNSDYSPSVAKWNMTTDEITPMSYTHPKIEKKRITFAVSIEHNLYVECYSHHDLLSICDIAGKLRCNVYGPNWNSKKSNKMRYYDEPIFIKNRILVAYSGNIRLSEERFPTKFLLFDIDGNYIKTIETGYRISDCCYDEDNNRVVMHLDEEMQFAYLNLEGILE